MPGQENPDQRPQRIYADLFEYSVVGIEMGAAVGIGVGIGWWLDQKFETQPVLTMVFLGFGLIAASQALYRAIKDMQAKLKQEEEASRSSDPNRKD